MHLNICYSFPIKQNFLEISGSLHDTFRPKRTKRSIVLTGQDLKLLKYKLIMLISKFTLLIKIFLQN